MPDGFVILNPTPESLPDDLELAYDRIGRGRVAVRSSASDEDGKAASFAGQHATVLDVEGMPALREAVVHCLHDSFRSVRRPIGRCARETTARTMSIIVQRMVDARCAGVMFTADPGDGATRPHGRRSRRGNRQRAARGRKSHARSLHAGPRRIAGEERAVGPGSLRAARRAAHFASAGSHRRHFGLPVECEWAIDRKGRIAWLQARPITTLPADPRELDTELNPDDVYTRCNIGEMFPGVATPLTWSTSIHSLTKACSACTRIASLESSRRSRSSSGSGSGISSLT